MNKNFKFKLALGIVLVLLLGALIIFVQDTRKENKELTNNMEALSDTLKVVRNKDSSQTATITAFETKSKEDFLKIKSKDEDIVKLQELVKDYKSKLKAGSSATRFTTETNIDEKFPTVIVRIDTVFNDTDYLTYPEYKSYINLGGWITGSSLANQDSTYLSLLIKNDYSLVVGEEGGLFKKRKPFAEVTSLNPYSEIKTLRTYKVSVPKPKRIGIGLHVGYGLTLNQNPTLSPLIGVGINYNLIEF